MNKQLHDVFKQELKKELLKLKEIQKIYLTTLKVIK